MKIGDYVRTECGIAKIKEFETKNKEIINLDEDIMICNMDCYRNCCTINQVIKSSPNIIDLIEVGDILYLEESDDIACMFFRNIYLVKNEDNLLHIIDDIKNKKCKLISIVTKEQFLQTEYKVGE